MLYSTDSKNLKMRKRSLIIQCLFRLLRLNIKIFSHLFDKEFQKFQHKIERCRTFVRRKIYSNYNTCTAKENGVELEESDWYFLHMVSTEFNVSAGCWKNHFFYLTRCMNIFRQIQWFSAKSVCVQSFGMLYCTNCYKNINTKTEEFQQHSVCQKISVWVSRFLTVCAIKHFED